MIKTKLQNSAIKKFFLYYLKKTFTFVKLKTTQMKRFLPIIFIVLFLITDTTLYGQFVDLGSGTTENGTQSSSPVNIYYRRNVCQFVYTAAELSSGGMIGSDVIQQIGWYVTQVPIYDIPGYTIKMKHVTVQDVSSSLGSTGWTEVKSAFTYSPTAGGYDMITFNQDFIWNGTDNIGIEVCWAQVQPNYNATGQCRIYSSQDGYRFSWTDVAGNSCGSTPNIVYSSKPQARIGYTAGVPNDVGVFSFNMNNFYSVGTVIQPEAIIRNYGSQAQSFNVQAVIHNGTSNVYTDNVMVNNLAPYDTITLNFSGWASVAGNYTITVQTQLAGDVNPSNNAQTRSFTVDTYPIAFTACITDLTYFFLNIGNGNLTSSGTITMSPFPMAEEFDGNQVYRLGGDFSIGSVSPSGVFSPIGTLTGIAGTPTGLAWNWNTNTMYVMVLTASHLPQLCTLNMSTLELTLIGTGTEGRIQGIDFADDGYLYGPCINTNKLFRIDPSNGQTTAIGDVGLNLNFAQDVSFDLASNQLYTITCGQASHFGTYSLLTGQFTMIEDYNGKQHSTIVITNPPGSGNDNDMMVYDVNEIQSGCGLFGNQSITALIKNNGNNTQINIPVRYSINGGTPVNEVIPGPMAASETLLFTFSQTADLSAPGTYNIEICTALTGDENPSNNCQSLTVTKYPHEQMPYSMGFELNENPDMWTIMNINGGSTWQITEYQQLARTGDWLALYEYDASLPANDWLISTCLELFEDQVYELSFWYSVGKRQGTVYPEKLKVAIGNEPDAAAMTNIIVDLGTINNLNYQQSTSHFSVPNDGIWYIGWHAYSNAGMFYISIDDIMLDISQNIEDYGLNNLNVFPNPASHSLYLSAAQNIVRSELYNMTGQQVFVSDEHGKSLTVDVAGLPNGIYLLKIIFDNETAVQKVVISK